jgi:hypothetical protein
MKPPTLLQMVLIAGMIPVLDWIFLYFSPALQTQPWLRFGAIAVLLLFLWVPLGDRKDGVKE